MDVDVVVVGSGFGGCVTALRLPRRATACACSRPAGASRTTTFAKTTSWDVRNFLWAPALGCYGIQRIAPAAATSSSWPAPASAAVR